MSKFIAVFVDRSRTVLTAMVVLFFAGFAAFLSLPREADPDIDIPIFYISIPFPGISPEDAERLIIQPMETHLRSLEGLKEMRATASQHHAGIILEFEVDFDKNIVLGNIRNKVDQAKAEIPADAEEPEIFEFNTALFPILIITIAGDVPERTLYTYAKRLQDLVETIPNILEAKLEGHREELLEIVADPAKMASYNIQYEQLISKVARNNLMVAAGSLDTGHGQFSVKLPGLVETAEDLFNIPLIGDEKGGIVLSDISDIRRTFKDQSQLVRVNGKPALSIQVVKRIGANIVETSKTVRAYVDEAKKQVPDSISIGYSLDTSSVVDRALSSLRNSVMTAIMLVMIIVVATLGLRSGSLVGFAIPISFMMTFFFLAIGGFTINMMVLFGLVLSVGMLVDSAIVIVEYADRKMAEGLHKKEAFIMASQRMFFPIIASTATTLAAFIPLLLWPGVTGQFMSYLPLTLIVVLSSSLVTALIFLPVIGSIIGKTSANKKQRAQLKSLAGSSSSDETIPLTGATGIYLKTLRKLVHRPLLVLGAAFGICFIIITLFGRFNNGVELFVQTEPEYANVFVGARGNLSIEDKRALMLRVEKEVLSTKGIDTAIAVIGGSVNPGDRNNRDAPRDLIGTFLLELLPYQQRRKGELILEEIRQRGKTIAGIHVEVRKLEEGPPQGKNIQIEITSTGSREELYATTAKITNHLKSNVSGLTSIEDSRPLPGIEWVFDVDREIAARYGADIALVGSAIQLVTNGILIGNFRPSDSDEEVEIRVRFPREGRALDQLDSLRLPSPSGQVAISNFVKRKAQKKVDNIERVDGRRQTLIRADTIIDPATGAKVLTDDKINEIRPWLEKQDFGPNIHWRFRGSNEEQDESTAFLSKAMIAALFLIFLILITQFNSFYQSMITLSTVIFSVMGVLIGLMLAGHTFSVIMTGTGVMALAGIVVNNSIVLIDTFNRLRQEFSDPIEAVLRTAAQRLRPILLTTCTTIIGLLPMALQIQIDFFKRVVDVGGVVSVWWVQMSTAIIYGLAFSTMLTLILTPVLLCMPVVLKESYYFWKEKTLALVGVKAKA